MPYRTGDMGSRKHAAWRAISGRVGSAVESTEPGLGGVGGKVRYGGEASREEMPGVEDLEEAAAECP